MSNIPTNLTSEQVADLLSDKDLLYGIYKHLTTIRFVAILVAIVIGIGFAIGILMGLVAISISS